MLYRSVYFFFFKQKTAYEMRISDWSSDVCSSDLASARSSSGLRGGHACGAPPEGRGSPAAVVEGGKGGAQLGHRHCGALWRSEIGRASCRERVCQYV